MNEWLMRFLLGGVIVSIFSGMGDVLRPKSFAGLFGAAPSVALATLALTVSRQGTRVAAIECRSMIFGALALALYSFVVTRVLMKWRPSALVATSTCLVVWLSASAVLYRLWG